MRTNYRAQGARLSALKRPDGKEIQKGGDTCTRVADSVARVVKNLPTMWETQVRSLGWEDSLEKEMATHSSGESHGQRSLVGHSPWGPKESDTTETTFTFTFFQGFPGGSDSKESACKCRRHRFDPWVRKVTWKREWQPIPVFLPAESHGQRSLASCSPGGSRRVGHSL